ncbi:MAG: tetratricopeptide repeat protein [Bacteroidaceae bacterium]|nr:tetratricopeptide repeat protein [Bacteroidaceae bacterium]
MASFNYKSYPLFRPILLISLLLSAIIAYANTDTLQVTTLQKAHRLIEGNDSTSQALRQRIDSLNNIQQMSDSAFAVFLSRNIGTYFRLQGQQSNVIEIFADAVHGLEQKKCRPNVLMRLYLPLGAAFEEVGLWSSAMEYYHKALRIAEDNNLQADIARIYNNIGAAYYDIDIKKSEHYMNKSLDINSKLGDKTELFLNYNNLAAIYLEQKNYDEALDYALKSLQFTDRKEDPEMYHSMLYNIGSLYLLLNEPHLSVSYMNNAKDYFEKANNLSELSMLHIGLIEAHEKLGNSSLANMSLHFIEDSLLPHINNSEVEADTRTKLAAYYENKNNYVMALRHLKEASILKDSLTKANDAWRVNNLERIYDNEQKLRENALVINEMKLSKMRANRSVIIVVIALIASIVFIVFLFIRSRLQNKLHRTNTQLVEQQLALQEKEKELQQIKEKELSRTIDQKNRELSSYALSHTKDNEFLIQLSEELKKLLLEINPRNKEHKEHIRNILAQIKQHNTVDNWKEFRYYFEQVHPSFYERLDEISPGITQHQKRLCAMLYIGLSTKEISSITFREVRSIESARNRLRKKLQVPAEESIQEFISRKLDI